MIHALLYKPKDKTRTPLVVHLHGGPESQARPIYSAFVQYLIHNGIAVVDPNFRGSSGYGKKFQKLIRRDWGGGELRDVEYLVLEILKEGWVDAERIGVFGGSFGGFLTLSCVTRLPKYWRVAAEWFGPSNLVSFAKSVPPYWKRYMKKWVGDPEDPEDLKMLEKRSPIKYIDNIRCPLLVVQGANDIRVVKSESDQVVKRLRDKGVEVEYIVFDDEGHLFSKEINLKHGTKKTIEFLIKHLLKSPHPD
jgi:dipeptidyl aminopeptidase/acylaminoacyl peptidase